MLMPPAPIDRDVGGGLEEKGAQIADGPGLIQTQEPHIGFLRHFEGLVVRAHTPSKKTNQRLVGLAKQPFNDVGPRFFGVGYWFSHLVGRWRRHAHCNPHEELSDTLKSSLDE